VAPSDAIEKNRNILHPAYILHAQKKILENLLSVRLLVRTNLFIPNRIWTTRTSFDNCFMRNIATCGKYEVVRTNFSADFGLVIIFDGNFTKMWHN